MVAHGDFHHKKQGGNGVLETLLSPFTVSKYGHEMHSRSLDPKHFLQPYSFNGPFTEVKLRDQLGDNIPLNKLDAAAEQHDRKYMKEQEEYKQDHDRKRHLNNIWRADDVFIEKARTQNDDPIMGNIASKLISTKEKLEKANMIDTKRFSGMGIDPTARLKELVKSKYRNEERKQRKMHGGLGPLAVVALGALGAVAKELAVDLYKAVHKKLTGSGFKFNHKTHDEIKKFLIEVLKNM